MTLPLLVALVGLTSCILNTIKKHISLILIYSRCHLDIFVGFSVIIYIGVIIRKALDANKVTVKSTYFVVFSSPPSDFLWPIRFILSVFILFWRIIILARPQFAKSCSPKIACSTILILSLAFSITDVLVFFLGCLVQLTAHPGCMALGCMAGPCFAHYATINRTILFSLTFLCVFIHSILICFYEIKETGEKRIEKVRF
ncbi:hypothetical protein L3Y34_008762 [Caenorhabditis briggsae]|uniref:Uncharacterized protein n=1 Tax=Caenorhabditis briggsae TaxID=6238 RepID=A0AAE9D247_CAEBR|nr:hypothetical protein L3Y34_008762 [Caenorhabditis briggsae]